MTRQLIKFSAFTLTVLLADLIKEFILKHIPTYHSSNPYKITAVSMALAVVVFVPAFALLDKYIKATAVNYVKQTRIIPTRKRTGGLIIGLALALLVLYSGYLYVRHDIVLHKSLIGLVKKK